MARLIRRRWTASLAGKARRDRQGCDYDEVADRVAVEVLGNVAAMESAIALGAAAGVRAPRHRDHPFHGIVISHSTPS